MYIRWMSNLHFTLYSISMLSAARCEHIYLLQTLFSKGCTDMFRLQGIVGLESIWSEETS